jgi:hypothetical protein
MESTDLNEAKVKIMEYYNIDGLTTTDLNEAKKYVEQNYPGYSIDNLHDNKDGSIGYKDALGNGKVITISSLPCGLGF